MRYNEKCPDFISVLLYFSYWSLGINDSNKSCVENWITLKPVLGGGGVMHVALFIVSKQSVIVTYVFWFGFLCEMDYLQFFQLLLLNRLIISSTAFLSCHKLPSSLFIFSLLNSTIFIYNTCCIFHHFFLCFSFRTRDK